MKKNFRKNVWKKSKKILETILKKNVERKFGKKIYNTIN